MATFRKRGEKWQAQVRRQGHPPVARSFDLKADAQAWARKCEAEVDCGVERVDRSRLRQTLLSDLLSRYELEVTPRKKSREVETYYLRAMSANPVGSVSLDRLTTTRLAQYRDERLKIVCASSVRREFNVLRHCLEVAIQEWNVGLTSNPLKGLRMPPEAPARVRRVQPEELQSLALALKKSRNALLVSVINLAILTGMRRSELLGLRWADIELRLCLAHLRDTKNGHPRHVPLSPAAIEVLRKLPPAKPTDLVLPISPNAVRLSWERLKTRAGIEDLRFHDLRHEAISRFFEAGLSVPEVSLISGHRDPRMLLRYTHLRPEAVAQRLSASSTMGVLAPPPLLQ